MGNKDGYMAGRYASRKRLLNDIKLAAGCVDCGYKEHPAALDFDHRDPSGKTGNVSQMVLGNLAKLMAEVEKCDVRCANCHRIRTQTVSQSGREVD